MNIKKKMSFGGIKFGFSLAEMMVVMLIVSIVMAASAPMVTRKVKRAEGKIFDAWGSDAANVAIYLRGREQRLFMDARQDGRVGIVESRVTLPTGAVFFGKPSADNVGTDSVGLGFNVNNQHPRTVAIGNSTKANGIDAMAIGMDANAASEGTIAIGAGNINAVDTTLKPAYANGTDAIAIGRGSSAAQAESVALGKAAYASTNAVAVGARTSAANNKDIAIGWKATALQEESVAIGNEASAGGRKSVAIGGATVNNKDESTNVHTQGIAIGLNANTDGIQAVAIGPFASAAHQSATALGNRATVKPDHCQYTNGSVAVGNYAIVDGQNSVALGSNSKVQGAVGDNDVAAAVAIGYAATATKGQSTAIGWYSSATGSGSLALRGSASGYNSVAIMGTATRDNQIAIGGTDSTVYIPGKLIVGGDVALGTASYTKRVYIRGPREGNKNYMYTFVGRRSGPDGEEYDSERVQSDDEAKEMGNKFPGIAIPINQADRTTVNGNTVTRYSDRRLKNVGKPYTAGLAELSKLTFYNFTFKKDETKTPQVGVIAQDLQKVFPNAVVKGEDGYLRIRWDEMFFAVINAVKELGTKVAQIEENLEQAINDIVDVKAKLAKQEEQIKKQELIIQAQDYKMSELESRLEKLEKGTK